MLTICDGKVLRHQNKYTRFVIHEFCFYYKKILHLIILCQRLGRIEKYIISLSLYNITRLYNFVDCILVYLIVFCKIMFDNLDLKC